MEATYFQALSTALKQSGFHRPTLVLDLDRLNANIAVVKSNVPDGLAIRIVDKSLPSLPLMDHIIQSLGTRHIMSFHLPVTLAVLRAFPDADILFGKPMPVAAVRDALTTQDSDLRERLISQTVWLIDTPERLKQYSALAVSEGIEIKFAFEVDCGMHRGGFSSPQALHQAVMLLETLPGVTCCGLMAYEAHIPEIPGLLGGAKKEMNRVEQRLTAYCDVLPAHMRKIINTGGSKTTLAYDANSPATEVSMGSGFLKPTDFDVDTLSQLQPAIFIATPVLKIVEAALPGPKLITRFAQTLGVLPRKGCFLYGGKWFAHPVWPIGMKENRLWGSSSNQHFMALPDTCTLESDDLAFLRPTQSEAVLQQFGALAVYKEGRISNNWDPISPR